LVFHESDSIHNCKIEGKKERQASKEKRNNLHICAIKKIKNKKRERKSSSTSKNVKRDGGIMTKT
jgi:hypothetical protein